MLRVLLFFFLLFASIGKAQHVQFSRQAQQQSWLAALLPRDEIDAYFFDATHYQILVLDEGDIRKPRYGSLEQAMHQNQCVAGSNGGYFAADATGTPIGLLKHHGRTVTPFSSGSFTVSGLLYDTGTTLQLTRSKSNTRKTASMREALQGGPFLVEQGKLVSGLNNTRKARRTLIATNGHGKWCLAVTSPLTLKELALWLQSPGALGSFHVHTALNLDGGTSSAFWCDSLYRISHSKPVRNYIGIIPRKRHQSK